MEVGGPHGLPPALDPLCQRSDVSQTLLLGSTSTGIVSLLVALMQGRKKHFSFHL